MAGQKAEIYMANYISGVNKSDVTGPETCKHEPGNIKQGWGWVKEIAFRKYG